MKACEVRDSEGASLLLARHLARSALTALAKVAPEWDPAAIRQALRILQRTNE